MGIPYSISMGTEHPGIILLQTMLAYIALFIPEIPSIERDGVFGPATEEAVSVFQSLYGLESTGIVNADTWNKLAEVYVNLRYNPPAVQQ
ncbi:hypothetical protein SDC9_153585 [bioreactor metagenome]|uniref:Peptidoglycan binding-like domain-containing protein n=2 Tax=root TaxID=1 RepID=A0A645EYR8_9ZZZZ